MKWLIGLVLFAPVAYANMVYIAEYRDVEHYDDAQTRLGGYPEVNELLRWRVLYELDTVTDGIVKTTFKQYAVAGLGDTPAPPTALDPNQITESNLPNNGDLIEVTNDSTFSTVEQKVFHQFINGDIEYQGQVITIVASDGEANYEYWQFGRTIEQPVESIVVPTCYVNTTKSQVYGLLTRWNNIMQGDSIGSVFISLGNLFLDSENVIIEIQTLRDCIKDTQ